MSVTRSKLTDSQKDQVNNSQKIQVWKKIPILILIWFDFFDFDWDQKIFWIKRFFGIKKFFDFDFDWDQKIPLINNSQKAQVNDSQKVQVNVSQKAQVNESAN